jgi:hypothetical protein
MALLPLFLTHYVITMNDYLEPYQTDLQGQIALWAANLPYCGRQLGFRNRRVTSQGERHN